MINEKKSNQTIPAFSERTLAFLKKAARQKNIDWLAREKNRAEYDKELLLPLQHLASSLENELAPVARGYRFPQKGIGRLKRSANRAQEYGSPYKDWISYQATRPTGSRFDHNPNLFFLIQANDAEDPVLVAGGLYVPSSRQLRAVREAIAKDASAFDRLFASKDFARSFPGGFSDEKKATRPPRGFDPSHPRIEWLKLQAYFVWRPYPKREWASKNFPALVARDMRQILRLNELLDQAIQGRLAEPPEKKVAQKTKSRDLIDRLGDLERFERTFDF